MFLETRILFIFTEMPLHVGAGSGLGAVDLPIQRERSTGYPIVQASGIKGALRSEAQGAKKEAVFGPDTDKAADHAGALSPGDARILLFPVRSLSGVFAWTTSMLALHRFQRERNQAFVSGQGVSAEGSVVLEEYAFTVADDQEARQRTAKLANWLACNALPDDEIYAYWQSKLRDSLVILPNDAFGDFLLHATEIVTRVRLEPDSKTVARGALWTEEHLPSDSLLYAPVHATRLRIRDAQAAGWPQEAKAQASAALEWVSDKQNIPHRFQLGGDETVGRGMVHVRWSGGAA